MSKYTRRKMKPLMLKKKTMNLMMRDLINLFLQHNGSTMHFDYKWTKSPH